MHLVRILILHGVSFFKKLIVDIGYFYIFWAALMVVATSNAVNFTDGLDGLAIGALISNALISVF